MPDQRRAQGMARIERQQQRPEREILAKRRRLAERPVPGALTRCGRPDPTDHPRQFEQSGTRAGHKPVGIAFLLGRFHQTLQPDIEGQGQRHQVARKEHPQTGEARPRVPCPGNQEQHQGHRHQGVEHRLDIQRLTQQHERQAAEYQHRHQQENEDAIEKIDHPAARHRVILRPRQQQHHHQHDRQPPGHQRIERRADQGAGRHHARHQPHQQHGHQITKRQQIEDARRTVTEHHHPPTQQRRQEQHPQNQQPVAEQPKPQPQQHCQQQYTRRIQPPFRLNEWLPENEQADIDQPEHPPDRRRDPRQQGQVQHREQRHQHPTLALA